MKTSTGKEVETKKLAKQDFSNKDTNTEEIKIDENEYKSLKEKAEFYDEIQKKCEELEKEIGELQIKYDISEEEMKKIDEEVKIEIENKKDSKPATASDKEEKVKGREDSSNPTREKSKKTKAKSSSSSSSSKTENIDDFILDKDNKTIPDEWKILKKKSDKKRVFKSPNGFTFNSRVEALEYMINKNYPERSLSLMRNHLTDEGWYQDKSCPTKWRLRKKPDRRDYEYLSPAMSIVPSMAEMMQHLQSQVPANSKEITNLQNKINSLNSLKPKVAEAANQSAASENQEEILPPGWSKKRVGGGTVFVSPDGEEVPTIQQLLTIESQKTKRKIDQSKKGQSETLEDHFQVCMFPDEEKLAEIGRRHGKSVSDLKKWFLKRASEESKKRLKSNAIASDPKQEKNHPTKPKGSKKKMVKSFNELTEEQNTALLEVLKTSPNPLPDNVISELSTKHHIEQKLVIKWFNLKRQQRTASQ